MSRLANRNHCKIIRTSSETMITSNFVKQTPEIVLANPREEINRDDIELAQKMIDWEHRQMK